MCRQNDAQRAVLRFIRLLSGTEQTFLDFAGQVVHPGHDAALAVIHELAPFLVERHIEDNPQLLDHGWLLLVVADDAITGCGHRDQGARDAAYGTCYSAGDATWCQGRTEFFTGLLRHR